MAEYGGPTPLRPIVAGWNEKIRLALKHKKERFQDSADEAMRFYTGPYDWLYNYGSESGTQNTGTGTAFSAEAAGDIDFPKPSFRMTVNKVAELVQIFGPALYHKNPIRIVNPAKPPMLPMELFGDPNDPTPLPGPPTTIGMNPNAPMPPATVGMMVQQQFLQVKKQVDQLRAMDAARASLLEHYLNYTPSALDLKAESRNAIDEAMIKGQGCMWTEVYQPKGAPFKMIGSFYRTVDDLVVDPDVECLQDAKWIALRCCHPYWEVEQEYGLEPDSLKNKATAESTNTQAEVNSTPDGIYKRRQGQTNDLMTYWKIWSKMGVGNRLKGEIQKSDAVKALERFGSYVYLVICEDCAYPLNIAQDVIQAAMEPVDPMATQDQSMAPQGQPGALQSPQQMADQAFAQAIQWPTPFWADDTWPMEPIAFHFSPRQLWPMSHIRPALGELRFLNWAFSFLMQKIKIASRDFIAIAKSAGEEVKKQITTGQDYTLIEVTELHGSIDKMVSFLQHPGFNPEIWNVIKGVTDMFERRTGLSELMYGLSSRQMRSAEEANVKSDQISIRPDDMANKVEDSMGRIAAKEAFAARWHLTGQDVAPIMGPLGAQWWDQFVVAANPAEIIHQLEYRIEAGSAKKPNKSRDVDNMQAAMQNLSSMLFQYTMQTGDVGPTNALMAAWAKSLDMEATQFMLKPPPAPPPMVGPGPPNSPPSGRK